MAGYTLLRQEDDIRRSDVYNDTIAVSEANMETNSTDLEYDMNAVRSVLSNLIDGQAGDWWTDLVVPSALDTGAQRGVNDLNTDLHALERKRVLTKAVSLVDVTVSASENWVILGTGELPPNTTAALGAVTTAGTVVAAHGGTFGTHSLAEVAGSHALAPKNFVEVVDGATRDPLTSSDRRVYGLLHAESGISDGTTITDTTTTRVQVSFVRPNAAGDDLEAVPVADIENAVVNFCFTERKALDDLTEQDFLRGAVTDVPAGATVDRQTAYNNQGTTPVDVTTNSILDLEGAGLAWEIRDDAEARLFAVIEGSAGGTSTVQIAADVDTFDVNAVDNDFANGATFDTAGTGIQVAETAGVIERAADLILRASGAGELYLDDSNQAGSTWTQTDGIKLSEATAEWDTFETNFGETSLLDAINQAYANAQDPVRTWHEVTVDANADVDVSGPSGAGNVDVDLPDLSAGTFIDNHWLFLNGRLMRPGADAAANYDYYPGTALTPDADIRFERKVKDGDIISVITWPNT